MLMLLPTILKTNKDKPAHNVYVYLSCFHTSIQCHATWTFRWILNVWKGDITALPCFDVISLICLLSYIPVNEWKAIRPLQALSYTKQSYSFIHFLYLEIDKTVHPCYNSDDSNVIYFFKGPKMLFTTLVNPTFISKWFIKCESRNATFLWRNDSSSNMNIAQRTAHFVYNIVPSFGSRET